MSSMPAFQERTISRRMTAGDGQYFFGYYDVPAFSGDNTLHLAHRTEFCDRLQQPGDVAEIGTFDVNTGQYKVHATTAAWNFQQGAMLQWHPGAPGEKMIYNALRDGSYQGAVHHLPSGRLQWLERPVAAVDPCGSYALGINFSRLYTFRPGYGYADVPDPFQAQNFPADDGIYRIDLQTGASRLIISLQQVWEFIQPLFQLQPAKMLINHITVNTDGSRFVFLARTVRPGKGWHTALLTAAPDGSGLRCLSTSNVQSHYHWKNERQLLIYGGGPRGNQLYLYDDAPFAEPQVVDAAYFTADGHCSYSPDRQWILYDSYPDRQFYRHLYLYHPGEARGITLGSYFTPPIANGIHDIRCDLHPRWNRDGTAISFDSVHEGSRHIYLMDLQESMAKF